MRILYIHQYFKTPRESAQNRSYILARALVKRGHQVTMLTASNTKGSVRKKVDGIDVIYVWVPYSQSMGPLSRISAFVRFMFKATLIAFKQGKVDLVIATSTPIFVGFPALLLKKIKHIPYIFEVRDLWPEAPIQLGWLKNPILIKLAQYFELTLYRNAWQIIGLSPGIVKAIGSNIGVNKAKLNMIANIAQVEEFKPRRKDTVFLQQNGLAEKSFKVIYFGSFGFANNIDYLLDAAKELKNHHSIEFILLGDGSGKGKIAKFIQKNNLNNVKLLGPFSLDDTIKMVNLADVSVITFMNKPILETNSPNKFFDSLVAGKPVLINVAGWLKQMVVNNKCGLFVSPVDKQDLVEKILYLASHPAKVKEMGVNARRLAVARFSDKIATDKFIEIVEKL